MGGLIGGGAYSRGSKWDLGHLQGNTINVIHGVIITMYTLYMHIIVYYTLSDTIQ